MTGDPAMMDDMLFSLAHVAGARRLPGWDGALAAEIAAHFAAFAAAEIAPLDAPGDREGCRLVDGRVRMPAGFAGAYRAYAAQGWPGLSVPATHGGQGLDACIQALVSESLSGACHAFQMVVGLVPGAVRTLLAFGTAEQQARLIPPLASGACLATMCLTEPGAGSDLSRIRCRARPAGAGWRIEGDKIFASGGDQDMSAAILHLVLARTGAGGTRGLSLFACPSRRADGTRNAVAVTRIEEKMGLHAAPTCQLAFDGAEAELLGAPGRGLAAMFTLMNHARVDVALQGAAHAARAHDAARSHAAERVQGRRADGGDARLSDHADVQRMLDRIDMAAMGARGLAHLALVEMARGAGDLAEFLTPVAKVTGSQAGIEATDLGIQVLGGYGYLREYGLERRYRDVRVTAIYEGANGIHARMLATRGIASGAAAAFEAFLAAEAGAEADGPVTEVLPMWRAARALMGTADPLALAHGFMEISAAAALACVWSRASRVAAAHPAPDRIARLAGAAGRDLPITAGAALARLRAAA